MKKALMLFLSLTMFAAYAETVEMLVKRKHHQESYVKFKSKKIKETGNHIAYVELLERSEWVDDIDIDVTTLNLPGLSYDPETRDFTLTKADGTELYCGTESDEYLFPRKKKKKGIIKVDTKVSHSEECHVKVKELKLPITKRNGKVKLKDHIKVLLITN